MTTLRKTVCIETEQSSSIGGGIRLSSENLIYTTNQLDSFDKVRILNAKRFGKEIVKLTHEEIKVVLAEENNIQIVNNNGICLIPGMYKNPSNHEILSKTGVVRLLSKNESLKKYVPKSIILNRGFNIREITNCIQENFVNGSKIVLKHSMIDGNGNGVGILEYTSNTKILTNKIYELFNKFSKYLDKQSDLLNKDLLIQDFVENTVGEGSITFSIQNTSIENWGMVNNITKDCEYFGSTNFFSFIDNETKKLLEENLYNDFLPLLKELQAEGIRGNIGFDMLIRKKNDSSYDIYILESNGVHRTTGSSMPNSFGYNTQNDIFLGIPLSRQRLSSPYTAMDDKSLVKLANHLKGLGTTPGESQIMNIKSEGFERGYPCIWLSLAGHKIEELFDLFYESGITNNMGNKYVSDIFNQIKTI